MFWRFIAKSRQHRRNATKKGAKVPWASPMRSKMMPKISKIGEKKKKIGALPKNVTTFHSQEDGINHFCLRPNKWGVLAL